MELQVGSRDELYQIMVARYYSSSLARFMAVDPSRESIDLRNPQSWNRYAYALGNPVLYRDPDGRTVENRAIDDTTSQRVEDQKKYSPTVQALHRNKNILIIVTTGSTKDMRGGEHGGVSDVKKDKKGKITQVVVIDPTLTGSEEATRQMTDLEVGRGKQFVEKFDEMVEGMEKDEHYGKEEAQQIGRQIGNEIAEGKNESQGKVKAGPHTGGPQTPGQKARVFIDGVDVGYY